MNDFFDPNRHVSSLFELGSPGHLALLFGLLAAALVMIALRHHLPRLRQRRAFMAGTAGFVLGLEATSYLLKFIYPCDPAWERLPLQLCASLKVAITVLILLGRYDWLKYLSVLALGCGFISFANLNMHGEGFGNFMWWHYVIGHLYLFLAPLFFILTGEHRAERPVHARMCLGLGLWSLTLFFVNWAFDTNYMYTGPHNDTVVPFLPASMMQWPFNYASYVLIAAVLLNGTYGLMRFFQRGEPERTASAGDRLPPALAEPARAAS